MGLIIKGSGATYTRRKVISCSARGFSYVHRIEICEMIGMWVPVEVLLYAAKLVERRFKEYGSKPMLRQGLRKDVSVITDNGNFVMDMDFR